MVKMQHSQPMRLSARTSPVNIAAEDRFRKVCEGKEVHIDFMTAFAHKIMQIMQRHGFETDKVNASIQVIKENNKEQIDELFNEIKRMDLWNDPPQSTVTYDLFNGLLSPNTIRSPYMSSVCSMLNRYNVPEEELMPILVMCVGG